MKLDVMIMIDDGSLQKPQFDFQRVQKKAMLEAHYLALYYIIKSSKRPKKKKKVDLFLD